MAVNTLPYGVGGGCRGGDVEAAMLRQAGSVRDSADAIAAGKCSSSVWVEMARELCRYQRALQSVETLTAWLRDHRMHLTSKPLS